MSRNCSLVKEGNAGMPFRWPAVVHCLPDELALVVVEHHRRAQQIGSAAAAGIRSVTEAAGGPENLGAVSRHFRIRHPAQAEKFPVRIALESSCSCGSCAGDELAAVDTMRKIMAAKVN